MIGVDQALNLVEQWARQLPEKRVSLREALGLRLAEPIVSEVDSPPFDKSLLDGYAVATHDANRERKVIEQVIAGGVPHHAVEPGTTILVMTGAPVPDGADTVYKHEDVKQVDSTTIRLPKSGIEQGSGILLRGAAFHAGQEVLSLGRSLSPVDIALLAEVGHVKVLVAPPPRVAVLPTGNELVASGRPIGPGQICNSNGPMLLALLEAFGAKVMDLGIGRDDPDELRRLMEQGLEADIFLVTGGVSAGVMDLVPGVLKDLGAKEVFHKVRMKPGKPLWFGQRESEGRRTLIFGLPGNPVSTLVSFEIFVKPALLALCGDGFVTASPVRGVLQAPVQHRGARPTYYPCRVEFGQREEGKPCVTPIPWRGSADLGALSGANALAIFPQGDYELETGANVDVLSL